MNSPDDRAIYRGHETASSEEDVASRMTPRPAWQPPPTEGKNEHERFKNLLARLLKVPKAELREEKNGRADTKEKKD